MRLHDEQWYKATSVKRIKSVPECYGTPSYNCVQLLSLHGLDRIPTSDDLELSHWLIGSAGIKMVDGIQSVFKDALNEPSSLHDKKFISLVTDFVNFFKVYGEDMLKERKFSTDEPLRQTICEKLLEAL